MIREVEGGYRLPRPQNCPKEMYVRRNFIL